MHADELTEEENEMHVLEQLIRTDRGEQLERIIDAVRPRIFFQVLKEIRQASDAPARRKGE